MTKKKCNILDIFIIVMVIVAVVAFGFKFLKLDKLLGTHSMQKVTYTVQVKTLRDVSEAVITDNVELKNSATKDKMGKVIKKVTKPAENMVSKADGTYDVVQRPDRYDVFLTIEAEGLQKEEGFFLYGVTSVGVGSTVKLETPKVIFEGQILELNVSNPQ